MNARQIEIEKLKLAIEKNNAARERAYKTLDALNDKRNAQDAELRFQKIMLWVETPPKEKAALKGKL